MSFVETLNSRAKQTRPTIVEYLTKKEHPGLAMRAETSYRIELNGEVVMRFGELEGIVRFDKSYDSLPEYVKILADSLESIGYKIEKNHI